MPNLVLDSGGKPAPQYLTTDGRAFEYSTGKDGAINVNIVSVPTGSEFIKLVDTNGKEILKNSEAGLPVNVINNYDRQVNMQQSVTFTTTGDVSTSQTITNECYNHAYLYLNITSDTGEINGITLLADTKVGVVMLSSINDIKLTKGIHMVDIGTHSSTSILKLNSNLPISFKIELSAKSNPSITGTIDLLK